MKKRKTAANRALSGHQIVSLPRSRAGTEVGEASGSCRNESQPLDGLAGPAPTLLMDRRGRVVETNRAWRQLYPAVRTFESANPQARHLGELPFDDASLQEIFNTVREAMQPKIHGVFARALVATHRPDDQKVMLTLSRIRDWVQLVSSASVWCDAFESLLAESFNLTGAEVAIIRLLIGGHTIDSVAEVRHTSVATVRTQIRTIYCKTAVSGVTELLRLTQGMLTALSLRH